MKNNISFILFSAALGLLPANASIDSAALSISIKNAVSADKTKVVEIVSREVAGTPTCACEVVKSAIEASNANATTVASIVEAAIVAAPDQMNLIAKCALTAAPDASAAVYAMVAKLGANAGENSRDSKDSKAVIPSSQAGNNVLDFPTGPADGSSIGNQVGPAAGLASGTAGGAGGGSIVIDAGGGSGGAGAGSGPGGGGGSPPPGIVTPPVSPNQP